MSACRHTNSIAGVRISAWRRPRVDLERRDHALVAADRDADLLGRGLDAEDQHRYASSARPRRSHRPAHPDPLACSSISRMPESEKSSAVGAVVARSVVIEVAGEADLEVVAERRRGHVAPLDEDDATERGQFVQRQVVDVGGRARADRGRRGGGSAVPAHG